MPFNYVPGRIRRNRRNHPSSLVRRMHQVDQLRMSLRHLRNELEILYHMANSLSEDFTTVQNFLLAPSNLDEGSAENPIVLD